MNKLKKIAFTALTVAALTSTAAGAVRWNRPMFPMHGSSASASTGSQGSASTGNGSQGSASTGNGSQGNSISTSTGSQNSSAASEVVRLTNIARTQNGYAALTEDSALSKAAAVRAREIASSFSHTRPSGSSFSSVLSENGVSSRRAGENIASGQKSASEVVNAWMNSSGHRANILSSSYSRIGTASVNVNGTLYWVQLFAD